MGVTRSTAAASALLIALTLTGCASAGGSPLPRLTAASATPTITPTAACPQQPGVELPPECAGYDPEHAIAQNDRHRERVEMPDDAQAENDAAIAPVSSVLEDLRGSGVAPTDETVRQVLVDAGLTGVQVREDGGRVLFGAGGPGGGCLYGEIDTTGSRVEAGGFILDGGCLPAQ